MSNSTSTACRNQLACPPAKDFGERIVDFVFLSDDAILVHGVTLLLGGSGGLVANPVTPPPSPRHPVSRIALGEIGEADFTFALASPMVQMTSPIGPFSLAKTCSTPARTIHILALALATASGIGLPVGFLRWI